MYRSASTNRVIDDTFPSSHPSSSSSSSSSSSATKVSKTLRALSLEITNNNNELLLPIYESISEADKKEKSRDKFAQNAVHIIPVLLILCAVILWFLSGPDIDMPNGGVTATRVEGLSIEGDGDSDGTQKGDLPLDLDKVSIDRHDHRKNLATKLN